MAKPRITEHQRAALEECRDAGRLLRRRDGWATAAGGIGAHSFQTVYSLVTRGLLSTDRQPKDQVAITQLGREAIS